LPPRRVPGRFPGKVRLLQKPPASPAARPSIEE
jgi:hypothetical protein